MINSTGPHVYRVSEIRDGVLCRVHGYYASLGGAFAYCEAQERTPSTVAAARFELFPVPGGEQWMIHTYYGPDDPYPEISDLVITRVMVIADAPAAVSAVVEPPADQTALHDRIAEAALAAVETALGDTLTPDAREEALAGIAAVLPEPADRATVLAEAADVAERVAIRRHEQHEIEREQGALDVMTVLRRMADETATTETPFTPPAHYRRDDGVECCVHTIPVGPDSCPACRELANNEPAAGPTIVDQVVAALQAKAQALSVEAEEEMRRDLEEQAQVWHEAADLARRTGRKAARSTPPATEARQDGAATTARPASTTWTYEACYDATNDKWHGIGPAHQDHDAAVDEFQQRINRHPERQIRMVRATTTYTVDAEHEPATARQDGATP